MLRILFFYVAVILVFLAFMFVFFFALIEREGIASEEKSLERYSGLMVERILLFKGETRVADIRRYITDAARSLDIRITFIDIDGTVIADSNEDPAYMENHSDRPEVRAALTGQKSSIVRYSATLKKNMLYSANTISENGKTIGVLRTSKFLDVVEGLITTLKLKYILVILFLVAVSVAAILFIHYNFKKEITRFAGISKKVSEGDFDVVFSKDESYEINELGKSFRLMVSKIKTLVSDLVFEKEEIESIISSVDEGIAVIDGDGRLVRANKSFSKIFNAADVSGRYYWEVIRENEIIERVKAGNAGKNSVVEFSIGDKMLLCSIDYLEARSEYVLIFYDVTNLRRLETVKKDLVTNVSHELRTPLTSIKGYVETLIDDETDGNKLKYLSIVLKNTERLSNIIKDLLLLSELEDKRANGLSEKIELRELVSGLLPIFEDKIRNKGLLFSFHAAEAPCLMTGDSFKLEQSVINLLDNALKYTDEGEITIIVKNENNVVSVEVKDSGIGIPEKDLDRIFERFYVVDKSRSRAHGGTGLGLSIVKHIVSMHDGEIAVTSSPGHGTSFVITFPAARQ